MMTKMIIEMAKQKYRQLVVLVSISIPLIAYYPIALQFTRSVEFATSSTMLLSVTAYVLSALKFRYLWQVVGKTIQRDVEPPWKANEQPHPATFRVKSRHQQNPTPKP
jgi:hypothetical protein